MLDIEDDTSVGPRTVDCDVYTWAEALRRVALHRRISVRDFGPADLWMNSPGRRRFDLFDDWLTGSEFAAFVQERSDQSAVGRCRSPG